MRGSLKYGAAFALSALLVAGLSAQELARSSARHGCGYQVSLERTDRATQKLTFQLDHYRLGTVTLEGQTFTRLDCNGRVVTDRPGYAQLPYFHAAIQLSPDKKLQAIVEAEEVETLPLAYPMLPSRGAIKRNQDPHKIPFVLAPEATRGGFFPETTLQCSEPFLYRDAKGQNLYFHAAQYDAGTQTLRIIKRMTVRLEEVPDHNPQALALQSRASVRPVNEMDAAYGSLFMNYVPAKVRWPHELGDMGDMLVLTTARDKAAIQPYVEHKKAMGFNVEVQEVAKGKDVKDTIKAAYEANKNLLYVQLVGGWAEIKCAYKLDGIDKEVAPMDPTLGWITDDHYAELIIGRFSGNSAAEITAQVNKTLAYEKDAGGEWVNRTVGIASSESGENGSEGDDGESDITHMANIRDLKLKPLGYTSTDFHGDKHGDKNSGPKALAAVWEKGLSVLNYAGHGIHHMWGTTGFDMKHAAALKNGIQAPVVCSVACLVGMYTNKTGCLAESLLKNPKGGAIAGMFATDCQDWAAPMRGQDYFNDMLVGGHQYKNGKEKGTDTDHGKQTFGAMAVNASILLYAESNKKPDQDTIETWTLFGDASLKVHRLAKPNQDPEIKR